MILESVQGQQVDWDEFNNSAVRLSKRKGLEDSQKLQLYGLYKQGIFLIRTLLTVIKNIYIILSSTWRLRHQTALGSRICSSCQVGCVEVFQWISPRQRSTHVYISRRFFRDYRRPRQ